MHPSVIPLIIFAVVALAAPASGDAAPPRGRQPSGQGGGGSSAAQAAEQARRQTGGRVLSIREKGGGYAVKVLTPSGEVRNIAIPPSGR
jgi:hypothetical protein